MAPSMSSQLQLNKIDIAISSHTNPHMDIHTHWKCSASPAPWALPRKQQAVSGRTGHERCSVFGERCSAFGVLFGNFACFVRWPFCSAWGVRAALDVLFSVLFGHSSWISFCTAFCSGLVFCSGTVFCSVFCSLNRCFVHFAKFGLNSVRVR